MRKIRCDEILNRNDFPNLNDKEFEEQVKRFCLDKLNEYSVEENKIDVLKEYPSKKYEIFKIDIANEKIFVLDTNLINYDGEKDDIELFYSRTISKDICDNLKRLSEDAVIGNPELESLYIDNINEIKNHIQELKKLDEDEYNLDRFIYNSLQDTNILEDYQKIDLSQNRLSEENKQLREQLKKSEKTILELSNKLKISLEDIEENRKKLQVSNQSKFEKMLNKLKEFLN